MLVAAVMILVLAVAAGLSITPARARGDEAAGEESLGPTAEQTKQLLESGKAAPLLGEAETDLSAAQTMPHVDLERAEALELAEAVFAPELESPAGIYGEFEPEKFVSNYSAVVPASSLSSASAVAGEGLASQHPEQPILLESTLPLRTEGESGEEEAVSLGLERSEGELQPQNPLAEVGLPLRLGEGISLPAQGIEVTVAGAPGARVATDASGEFAFYPEVAENTDLIVAPTPEGVETMADIRSADAPLQTTYDLALPPGAELRANPAGGATIVEGGRAIAVITPPSATDAAGDPVHAELSVSGDAVTVTTEPSLTATYPILVDPNIVTEEFLWNLNHLSLAGWDSYTTNPQAMQPLPFSLYYGNYVADGPDLSSGIGGAASEGTNADWEYWVPRFREDQAHGTMPTTWIYQMKTEGIQLYEYGNNSYYPAMVLGLVDPVNANGWGWQSTKVYYGNEGELTNWARQYEVLNSTSQSHDKGFDFNMVTWENESPSKRRDMYMPNAQIALVDEQPPIIGHLTEPSHWVNTVAEPISFAFTDEGLGVQGAHIYYGGAELPGAGFLLSCGTPGNACPRAVESSPEAGHPWVTKATLAYNPAILPTGIDRVTVLAGDVLWGSGPEGGGHVATSLVNIPVDHTGPEISLSGPLTEQGSLGTRSPSYPLRISAKDGVAGAPQSGVKKVEVLVDNTKVKMPEPTEWEPNCQSENCRVSGEWAMSTSEYAAGAHEVKVIATDAVGNPTTKTLQVELHPPAPTLSLSGTMTEQASLGTERPSYNLHIDASALAESPTPPSLPTYSSSFGSSGSGNGQLSRPGAMTMDAQGNILVVDSGNNRVEGFNQKGQYVSQFGTIGEGNGQFKRPTAVAVAANGNVWVVDSGNKRVEEFSPTATFLGKFGSGGTGNGQFAGTGPEAIAIDYHGNIWVADTAGGRLEKFNENGVFIRSVSSKGKGPGQLGEPDGIAISPGGNVFVSDWEDDKVVEFDEGGRFIREFGSHGNEPGQLQNPTGIAIDSVGDVWVADQNNGRIEEFNQAGEYLGRFGAKGTGAGQFQLTYPTGIVSDTSGDIWVSDWGNNRVEKWVSSNYGSTLAPTYLTSFGSPGTTAGHFSNVLGLGVDAKGNVWAADVINNSLQKFNSKGELLAAYGKSGSGNGELSAPTALTANSGHIWDVEMTNGRAQSFNESGGFLAKWGQPGNTAGRLEYPWGIAIDPGHHVWVTETGAIDVQEFSETGALIKQLGKKGSGAGEFNGATGIAVGPGGKIWIVDCGNNRVEEFTESGTFVRQFGGKESEVGHLSSPMGIYVDHNEHVWVVDRGHDRVVEFNGQGEYITQFGSMGSGQFTTPEYIVGDQAGHLFVSDNGSNKVEEWTEPALHSQVSTEITVDGKRVEAAETSCATETCSASKDWTLQSSSLTPGSHTVIIRATDGLGNSTSKTLNVKVGDATKPGLEVGGELAEAPAGWIQQEEGNYSFNAIATDAGFGVTSLLFSIDGSVVVPKTQTCAAGGCGASISTLVNAKNLTAGAHTARVVATDGAGNVSTKEWTINVDPEGHVSIAEAEATLQALEGSGPSDLLGQASNQLGGIPGEESGLGLQQGAEGQLEGTGSHVPLKVGENLDEGEELNIASEYSLATPCEEESRETESPEDRYESDEPAEEGPAGEETSSIQQNCVSMPKLEEMEATEEQEVADGLKRPGMDPITIIPPAADGSGEVEDVEGNAALAPNAESEVDTIVRPITDGGFTWEEIRGPQAPEHYAFEMELGPRQELRLVNEHEAAVFFKEDGVRAFTVDSTLASDAIGTEVPTHLSVNGEILTLTIEYHQKSPTTGEPFVYPIVSGTGWEGGWHSFSELIAGEPKPTEPPGQGGAGKTGWYAHQLPNGAWVVGESGVPVVGAPTYEHSSTPKGAASASAAKPVRAFKVVTVPWCEKYYGEENIPSGPPVSEPHWEGCLLTPNLKVRGFVTALFHYETSPNHAVWWDYGREEDAYCNFDTVAQGWRGWNKACQFSGPNQQSDHIVAKNFWRTIGHPPELALMGTTWGVCWPDYIDMFWNGTVSEEDMIENHGTPQLAPEGSSCNWAALEQ